MKAVLFTAQRRCFGVQ